MISDILYTAVREIDRYLEESFMYKDENGVPDPDIVKVRNAMFDLLLELDYPDSLLTPELLEEKQTKWLVEKRTPTWRPFMNT
ncbi:MAG: hypothetical protein ACLQVJ_07970 [Syntrophobacteraceae bacterium]